MKTLLQDFLDERELYDKTLKITGLISINQHNLKSDGRGLRGMKIFTRQTLTAYSLDKLLPRPNINNPDNNELWDISSIASLTRNLMEGYLSLHFYGLEKVSSEEANLRFVIQQFNRNTEWYNISKDDPDADLSEFINGLPEQKERIKNHPYLDKLNPIQKKRALRGIEIYKTKADFENEISICTDLRKIYRLLSNLVHSLPLSIERVDNKKGRGIRNRNDIYYSIVSIMLARRFLAASTVGIADCFQNTIGRKFKNEVDSLRPLINKGFEK